MGIFGDIVSISDSLFGKEEESDVTTSGRTDKATQTDSGQTKTDTTTRGPTNTIEGPQVQILGGGTVTESARVNSSTSTTKNSGRTDVQQLMLTQEGVDNIVRTILEGVNGLAATTSGQRTSGIYNSTANQMLVDDLITRTAGFVAEKSAPLVTKIGESTSTVDARNVIGGGTTTYSDRVNYTGAKVTNTLASTDTNTSVVGPRTIDATNTVGTTSTNTKNDKEGLLDWVICTELLKQGKFSNYKYVIGSQKFKEYDDAIKRGYYVWAIPTVIYMRKHPDSLYTSFLNVWFNSRASYICALYQKKTNSTHLKEKRTVLGAVSYYSTHAFCWILSRTVARKYTANISSLYAAGEYNG